MRPEGRLEQMIDHPALVEVEAAVDELPGLGAVPEPPVTKSVAQVLEAAELGLSEFFHEIPVRRVVPGQLLEPGPLGGRQVDVLPGHEAQQAGRGVDGFSEEQAAPAAGNRDPVAFPDDPAVPVDHLPLVRINPNAVAFEA